MVSPSTQTTDYREKRLAYKHLPSLQSLHLIESQQMLVQGFYRDFTATGEVIWQEQRFNALDDLVSFPCLGVELSVSAIYEATGLL